jgi:hypothetical protein
MQSFKQKAGTRRNYEFGLNNPEGDHPMSGRPAWRIKGCTDHDGTPAPHVLAELQTSVDGLRATLAAGARPGRIVVALEVQVDERTAVQAEFEVVIEAAPAVTHADLRPTFAQLSAGPI